MEGAPGHRPQEEEAVIAITGQKDAGSGAESAADKRGRGETETGKVRAEAADEPQISGVKKSQRGAAKSKGAIVQEEV